ncbi:S1 RNA-binding domain-containing protein [Ruegeria sp. HKCCD6428]|nr:S1 RNA-binding domain-containing protein [Ruegeria sp. HKCCD6428]
MTLAAPIPRLCKPFHLLEVRRLPNLIACPSCGKEVSRRARSCPQCGEPEPGTAQRQYDKERLLSEFQDRVLPAKVIHIVDFGAYAQISYDGMIFDGLVHVSQLSNSRLEHPNEIVSEGDTISVKVLGISEHGIPRLSMKDA